MFENRKKKLALRMITGVDSIKLILFKTISEDLISKYPDKEGDFCSRLAASAVNEIYGSHSQETTNLYSDNIDTIETALSNLGITNPDLKQPITDSLRVFIQANHMLGSPSYKNQEFIMGLFQKAIDRGLFNKGGDAPKPEEFLKMADEIAHRYGIK